MTWSRHRTIGKSLSPSPVLILRSVTEVSAHGMRFILPHGSSLFRFGQHSENLHFARGRRWRHKHIVELPLHYSLVVNISSSLASSHCHRVAKWQEQGRTLMAPVVRLGLICVHIKIHRRPCVDSSCLLRPDNDSCVERRHPHPDSNPCKYPGCLVPSAGASSALLALVLDLILLTLLRPVPVSTSMKSSGDARRWHI